MRVVSMMLFAIGVLMAILSVFSLYRARSHRAAAVVGAAFFLVWLSGYAFYVLGLGVAPAGATLSTLLAPLLFVLVVFVTPFGAVAALLLLMSRLQSASLEARAGTPNTRIELKA